MKDSLFCSIYFTKMLTVNVNLKLTENEKGCAGRGTHIEKKKIYMCSKMRIQQSVIFQEYICSRSV